jgi:tRNA(adenine34) deaminase
MFRYKNMKDQTITHSKFMYAAIIQARNAFNKGEIPVGAVIIKDGKIIARAHNLNRVKNNPVKHAEIICIEKAARFLNNERLTDCDLYVTKEPCAMCAGAIVHSRIKSVFIGTEDKKYGACGSAINVCGNKILNHVPVIEFGLLKEESAFLLREFFKNKRNKNQ